MQLTNEWLEMINEEFRKADVPLIQRPWLAWQAWAKLSGRAISRDDGDVERIFDWFSVNIKSGVQYFRPLFIGAFYYDSCFWPVFIPLAYGTVRLNAFDSLKTMPERKKSSLKSGVEGPGFASLWRYCLLYAFGMDDLTHDDGRQSFAKDLLISGNQNLRATVTLLLEDPANPKAVEPARMASELFLKAFLATKSGLSQKGAKGLYHDLEKALDNCLEVEPRSGLSAVRTKLKHLPSMDSRYKGVEARPRNLWEAYDAAQSIGAAVAGGLSGRDKMLQGS